MTYAPTDLVATQGVPYTRNLQYEVDNVEVDWTQWTVISQVRDFGGNLIFDLTPYLAISSGDHTTLVIAIPGAVTETMPAEGQWDVLAIKTSDPTQRFRTPRPRGRILALAGVTSDR